MHSSELLARSINFRKDENACEAFFSSKGLQMSILSIDLDLSSILILFPNDSEKCKNISNSEFIQFQVFNDCVNINIIDSDENIVASIPEMQISNIKELRDFLNFAIKD